MTKAEIQQVKLRFGIIGNNERLLRDIDIAIQVAPTDLSVLITGESGVGKESFPQIIHQYSKRKHGQYIAVNCGAIPEGTIDSELFGHEKGAFTGAISERKGYFGEADGGTIFLDEVGELPLPTQARLLRVLETGEFIKVGSSKVEKTNVRIVAATNVNLSQAIVDGRFREDLYYRLNTVPIQIPPLRERGEDVVLLFRKFASDFAEKYQMPAIQLTDEAKQVLLGYSWPGNVRQLKNITEQISIIETNREVTADILRGYLPQQTLQRLPALAGSKGGRSFENEREILYQVLFDMRRDYVRACRRHGRRCRFRTAAGILCPAVARGERGGGNAHFRPDYHQAAACAASAQDRRTRHTGHRGIRGRVACTGQCRERNDTQGSGETPREAQERSPRPEHLGAYLIP